MLHRTRELKKEIKKKKSKKRQTNKRGKGESRDTKKIPAHLYATLRMKCEGIYKNRSKYEIKKMCKALGMSRSAYYNWKTRRKKHKEQNKEKLEKIREFFDENRQTYGYRRMKLVSVNLKVDHSVNRKLDQ